jgi:hypothetical protein
VFGRVAGIGYPGLRLAPTGITDAGYNLARKSHFVRVRTSGTTNSKNNLMTDVPSGGVRFGREVSRSFAYAPSRCACSLKIAEGFISSRVSIPRPWFHRNFHIVGFRKINCPGITSVRVAEHTRSGIACQNAFQSPLGTFGAVSDHDHPGML